MKSKRFSIVITRLNEQNGLPRLPWLEQRYGVDEGDWIVLTHQSWRALADGEPQITADLERKLMMTFYVHQPELILVVGHPAGEREDVETLANQTRQILRLVEDCLLPTEALGLVVNAAGQPVPVGAESDVEMDSEHETAEPALVSSAAE